MPFFRGNEYSFFFLGILSCVPLRYSDMPFSLQPMKADVAGINLMSHLSPGSYVDRAVFVLFKHAVCL